MVSLELIACFIIFITSQLYSLVRFYLAAQNHIGEILLEFEYDFEVSCVTNWAPWTCHQPRDITDAEWQVAKQYYLQWKALFFVAHSFGFFLIKRFHPKSLPIFIIVYTATVLFTLLSIQPLLILAANIVISIFILPKLTFLPKHLSHYVFFILSIVLNNMYHADLQDIEVNLLVNLCISWMNAKCLSAAVDSGSSLTKFDLKTRFAYLLYFPSFFFGPIYHYSDFAEALSRLTDSDTINTSNHESPLIVRFISMLRYLFWAFTLEFVLKHYLYSGAYLNYPHLLARFDAWPIAGFGFSLVLLFFVKYFVLYGMGKSLAEIDGLHRVFAPPPQCIAHMNKTSYLWRKFDQGLYAFLLKYFYKPLTGSKYQSPIRRITANFVCFFIIAVWHEQMESYSIIVWVVINFFLLNIEFFALILWKSSLMQSVQKNISPITQSRLEAILGSPYLALAYLSNILFLSNLDSFWILVSKLFLSSWTLAVTTLGILYAGCQVCKYINGQLRINRKTS